MTVTITIERERHLISPLPDGMDVTDEHEVEAEFDVTPECRGSRGPFGEPIEPDEPASAEYVGDNAMDGITLTDREIERAEEKLWDKYNQTGDE